MVRVEAPRESSVSSPPAGWLFGPGFDLLFLANIAWPLFFLAQFAEGFVGRTGVQFWQVYFVTTPVFQTTHPKYSWLNRLQAIGKVAALKGGEGGFVDYDVYAVQ